MGVGKRGGVTVTNIVNGVNSWKVGVEGGAIIRRGSRRRGSVPGFRSWGGRGLEPQGVTRGAVLIRCDRSRTDEVMGARDAVISSLLGTVLATELTESWM